MLQNNLFSTSKAKWPFFGPWLRRSWLWKNAICPVSTAILSLNQILHSFLLPLLLRFFLLFRFFVWIHWMCFCSCCFMLFLSFYKLSKYIIESKWMFQTTINLYYDQSNCLLCSTIKFGTPMRKAGKKEWQLGTESLNNHARYVNCRYCYDLLQKYSNITSNTVALKIVLSNITLKWSMLKWSTRNIFLYLLGRVKLRRWLRKLM